MGCKAFQGLQYRIAPCRIFVITYIYLAECLAMIQEIYDYTLFNLKLTLTGNSGSLAEPLPGVN